MNFFDSVMTFCKRAQELDRLNIVLFNAGVKKQDWKINKITGHETTMQINHLSTTSLSLLLLPLMKVTAAKFGKFSRMTLTSFEVHM